MMDAPQDLFETAVSPVAGGNEAVTTSAAVAARTRADSSRAVVVHVIEKVRGGFDKGDG